MGDAAQRGKSCGDVREGKDATHWTRTNNRFTMAHTLSGSRQQDKKRSKRRDFSSVVLLDGSFGRDVRDGSLGCEKGGREGGGAPRSQHRNKSPSSRRRDVNKKKNKNKLGCLGVLFLTINMGRQGSAVECNLF